MAALEERRRRVGGQAGEQGGWGPPEKGGGSVTTRLDRSNYNPAVAPAYRATSDPSKRVAWEFGWRQRLAGGGARRGDHRLCAPSPAVWEERLCGGWEKGAGENTMRPQRVLSLTPSGLSLLPRELRTLSRPGFELCYTALTLEAVNLTSIICHHPPLHNSRPLPEPRSSNPISSAVLFLPGAFLIMLRCCMTGAVSGRASFHLFPSRQEARDTSL